MKRLGVFLLLAATMGMSIRGASAAAPTPQLGDSTTALFRYIDKPGKGPYFGKTVPMISMTKLPNGPKVSLVCSDDAKPTDQPSWLAELVKNAKKDDVFEVKFAVEKKTKQAVMSNMTVYEMKPGEDEPNVFVFDKIKDPPKGDKSGMTPIGVTKFRENVEFVIPAVRGSNGKLGPNEDLLKAVKAFKSGDSVEIQYVTGKMTVKSIKKYAPPRWARFVKLTKETVGEQELKAVEVDAYGNTLTLVVAPKDSSLLGKFNSLKKDTPITFKSNTDSKGTIWLTGVTIQPKDAVMPPEPPKEDSPEDTKPPDKKPEDGGKKAGDK